MRLHWGRQLEVEYVVHLCSGVARDVDLVPMKVRYSGLELMVVAIGPAAPAVIDAEHFAGHGIRLLSIAPNGIAAVR